MTPRTTPRLSLLAAAVLLLATACEQRPVYSHYEAVDINGWQQDDTLHFVVSETASGGRFGETLGMRASLDYPFTQLALVVIQQAQPSGTERRDTLYVDLIDTEGYAYGQGINIYQYDIPLRDMEVREGDTLFIDVHHHMKRNSLPGISDVGMTLVSRTVTTGIDAQKDEQQEREAPQ